VEVTRVVEVAPKETVVRAAYFGWLFRFQVRNAAADWEAANPGKKVKILQAGGPEFEKLSLQWAKGETDYDLFYIDLGAMAKFAEAGWLAEVTPYLKPEEESDPLDVIKYACTYKGKMYAYPCMGEVAVLNYHAGMLGELGVEPPKTWDEFESVGMKVKAKWPDSVPMGVITAEKSWVWLAGLPILQSIYGNAFDKDGIINTGKEMAEVFKLVKKWYDAKLLPEPGTNYWALYENNLCAMIIDWQRAMARRDILGKNAQIAPLPSGGAGGTLLAAHGAIFPKFSPVLETAVRYFVEGFARSPVMQNSYLKEGKLAIQKSQYEKKGAFGEKAPVPDWMKALLPTIEKGTIHPPTVWSVEADAAIDTAWGKFFQGKMTAEEALAEARATIEKAVAAAKK
jgi:ABC-type glycerol-3-phosphate transport system substrate-binding protein